MGARGGAGGMGGGAFDPNTHTCVGMNYLKLVVAHMRTEVQTKPKPNQTKVNQSKPNQNGFQNSTRTSPSVWSLRFILNLGEQ